MHINHVKIALLRMGFKPWSQNCVVGDGGSGRGGAVEGGSGRGGSKGEGFDA